MFFFYNLDKEKKKGKANQSHFQALQRKMNVGKRREEKLYLRKPIILRRDK